MKSKPLVAMVAMSGGTFTVHYHTEPSGEDMKDISPGYCGIQKQWYSKHLFDDLPPDLPALRFDLMNENDYKPCLFINGDYEFPTIFDRDVRDTAAYIAWHRDNGVPVQTVSDVLLDARLN